MTDQAAALRQLKKLVDGVHGDPPVTRDEFLSQVPRPVDFRAIGLLVPDTLGSFIPPLQNWFPGMMPGQKKPCVWDQGGLLAAGTAMVGNRDHLLPSIQTIESSSGSMTVLPRYAGLDSLVGQPDSEKYRFIRHVIRSLKGISHLWVTMQARSIPFTQALLHAMDGICILVPEHHSALLSCYESVKSVHLSGYFSGISLLTFVRDDGDSEVPIGERIRAVAKQFLALDLKEIGMVLSGQHFLPNNGISPLDVLLKNVSPTQQDFFYTFAERLVFPMPGEAAAP